MTALSLEARLTALETKLGVTSTRASSSSSQPTDLANRLQTIQTTMDQHTMGTNFRESWKESQKLFQELDPGNGLTHQQQPLLYRRQEVLAASGSMKADMDQLAQILSLLQAQSPLREDQVTQSPIITSIPVSPQEQQRLDAVRVQIQELHRRSEALTSQMGTLLEAYHAVMAAASEKCVLAEEALSNRERARMS